MIGSITQLVVTHSVGYHSDDGWNCYPAFIAAMVLSVTQLVPVVVIVLNARFAINIARLKIPSMQLALFTLRSILIRWDV